MRQFLIISLVLLLCATSLGTPISGTAEDSLGAFTGAGSEQDDNVKASLDLAHTDLDVMLRSDEDALALLNSGDGGVFYVNVSASGTTGVSWATAVNDLEEVQALLTGNSGEVVFLAPGHTETVGGAKAIDLDVADVTYYALGKGENRATFTFDTATDTIAIGADDVVIKNFNFLAGAADVAVGIVVETGMENFVIDNCRFHVTTAGTHEFTDAIQTAANADNGRISNCRVEMAAGAADAFIENVGCDYLEIYGNVVSGDFATGIIEDKTTASIWMNIHDNTLIQGDTAGALNAVAAITLKSDTSAVVFDNKIYTGTTEGLSVISAAGLVTGNDFNATAGNVLEVGKTYVRSSATLVSGATDNIFTVAGGRIEIISMFGECTTLMGTVGATDIYCDATAGAGYDQDLCTAVDIDALDTGDIITFTNAVSEGVLTFVANQGAGMPISWYCPAGILILDPATTDTGAVTWWMTFRPLEEGVTVVVGP